MSEKQRAAVGLGVLLVLASFFGLYHESTAEPPARTTQGAWKPIESVTPGRVLTTRASDVCTPGWSGEHREYLRVGEKRQVLIAYNLPADTKPSEWDHLISLELGGDNGPENIWPQLNHAQDQRKDRLENKLHREVCDGDLSLVEAQRDIEEFWKHW